MKKIGERDSEILLILDSYEDIFSDFDARPYSQKALSEDFLDECKKASVDKSGEIILNFFLSKGKRDSFEETNIKKRLKEHFFKHFLNERKELMKTRRAGFIWLLAGAFLIVLTTFLGTDYGSFFMRLLIAIAHPGGWFFMWEGLAKLILRTKDDYASYNFYKKMSNSKVYFLDKKK